jgi:hypothetical protein
VSAVFRVRRDRLFGKAILQKFDMIGGVAKFRDMPFQELGDFCLVPRPEWTAVTKRIEAADRAKAQRADKKRRDFEASRLVDE